MSDRKGCGRVEGWPCGRKKIGDGEEKRDGK